MTALAGSLYLVFTFAFVGVTLAIGARLLVLARSTGGRPELLLGLGLPLTGGVGYGLLVGASLARDAGGEAPALLAVATAVGKLAHDVGVVLILAFVVHVFRPGVAWARAVAAGAAAVMAVGFGGYALAGGLAHGRPEGFFYWLEFVVVGSYPVWVAAESFRYYVLMRRRRALGLADPVVTNRFLLWGCGSLLSLAAIWVLTLPTLVYGPRAEVSAEPFLLATAVLGIGSVTAYALTFFPPRAYRAWIQRGTARAG